MKRVAIVGSSESHWTPEQRTVAVKKIKDILLDESNYPEACPATPVTLISGGCPKGGIDIWAEIVADTLGIGKEIFLAEVKQWDDSVVPTTLDKIYPDGTHHYNTKRLKGYMSRNIQIANACDVLYCIDPKGRKGGGGQWTMNYNKNLGKDTHHIVIE
jgi:hypothetical protein